MSRTKTTSGLSGGWKKAHQTSETYSKHSRTESERFSPFNLLSLVVQSQVLCAQSSRISVVQKRNTLSRENKKKLKYDRWNFSWWEVRKKSEKAINSFSFDWKVINLDRSGKKVNNFANRTFEWNSHKKIARCNLFFILKRRRIYEHRVESDWDERVKINKTNNNKICVILWAFDFESSWKFNENLCAILLIHTARQRAMTRNSTLWRFLGSIRNYSIIDIVCLRIKFHSFFLYFDAKKIVSSESRL